jgi:D-threo-aldose 1-dehydrogenase
MTGTARAADARRLGFGCGGLGSEIGYRESCALIEAAYEAGFRHFDVAPPYGHGRAERIVGDVLAPVRQHVTLVGKAGIAHPRSAGLMHAVRRLALPLRPRLRGLWQQAAARARSASTPGGRFGAAEVLASVDESLRRLRTDHLDALLLHEVQPGDIDDALAATLRALQRDGRVHAIGTATGVQASEALLARHGELIEWVQTGHYWGAFRPALRTARRLLTHGSLRTGLALLPRPEFAAALHLAGTPGLTEALADPRVAAPLLLRAALMKVDATAVLLVSTTRRARLGALLEAAVGDPMPGLASALNRVFEHCAAAMHDPDARHAD